MALLLRFVPVEKFPFPRRKKLMQMERATLRSAWKNHNQLTRFGLAGSLIFSVLYLIFSLYSSYAILLGQR
jgi:hypothetical protein